MFVAYYRVSTRCRGRSGPGLGAQRATAATCVAGASDSAMAAEFTEAEGGRRNERPQLAQALEIARCRRATLLVLKLDRLARDARFLLGIVESGVDVVFCDLPDVPPGPVGRFLITHMVAVAEFEAGLISRRTKEALAVAKARGVRLGNSDGERARILAAADRFAQGPLPLVKKLVAQGLSLRATARELNERQVGTARGGRWGPRPCGTS